MTQQTKDKPVSSFLKDEYKIYAMYVLEDRAIPSITDGLKPVQRRLLQVARSRGLQKVNSLSGATMHLHPHGDASLDDAASIMAQEFPGANNLALLRGVGAFGSKVVGRGKGIGAARYVMVELSKAAERIMLHDIDIAPLKPNYDETVDELETFLPLLPVALLNPSFSIAVGFSTHINPRHPVEMIDAQIEYLQTKKITKPLLPWFRNFFGTVGAEADGTYFSTGAFEFKSPTHVVVTELPIGMDREQFVEHLYKLEENGKIVRFEDHCTSEFAFDIILPRKKTFTNESVTNILRLKKSLPESLWLLSTTDGHILNYASASDIIIEFTKWRLTHYDRRLKRRLETIEAEQKFLSALIKVIKAGLLQVVSTKTHDDVLAWTIKQVGDDEIAKRILAKPILSFNKVDINKVEQQLDALVNEHKDIQTLLKTPAKKAELYVDELKGLRKIVQSLL